MEYKKIFIKKIDDNGEITFDVDWLKLLLTEGDINEIKNFYNAIYEHIIKEEELIEFLIDDKINDDNNTGLFFEIVEVFIKGLNEEIKNSSKNIIEIIEHKKILSSSSK